MVENEKIIKENENIIPETILSDTVETTDTLPEETITTEPEEIKVEETITTKPEEIKVEEPEEIKVADASVDSFNEEQKKDFNRLLELNVEPEKAKKIIAGESVEIKKLDTDGKSEYEVEKEILANKVIDLDLIKKAKPEAVKISEEIYVDSAGIETKGGYIPAKTLYELNGYNADKENEITGDIRFNLGFGLDGDQFKENNIKNMLIKRITDSGKYDKEVLANYLDKIEVKAVDLSYEGTSKKD